MNKTYDLEKMLIIHFSNLKSCIVDDQILFDQVQDLMHKILKLPEDKRIPNIKKFLSANNINSHESHILCAYRKLSNEIQQ
jgi:hypothetical protein